MAEDTAWSGFHDSIEHDHGTSGPGLTGAGRADRQNQMEEDDQGDHRTTRMGHPAQPVAGRLERGVGEGSAPDHCRRMCSAAVVAAEASRLFATDDVSQHLVSAFDGYVKGMLQWCRVCAATARMNSGK